jgi:hypothetical protein
MYQLKVATLCSSQKRNESKQTQQLTHMIGAAILWQSMYQLKVVTFHSLQKRNESK